MTLGKSMISSDMRDQKQTEDLLLLRRYADAADDDAFRLVAGRYLDFVYTICLRELGNAQAAEDATQETFIALAKQARRLRAETVLPAWLFTVALARCRDSRRRDARHRRIAPAYPPSESPISGLELQFALASLPPRDREVVILRILLEYSHAEVAQRLGVSEDAARMRVDRALKRLRERAGPSLALLWPLEIAPFDVKTLRLPSHVLPRWQPAWLAAGVLVLAGGTWTVSKTGWMTSPPPTLASSLTSPTGSPGLAPTASATLSPLLPMHAKVVISDGGQVAFSGETWRTDAVIRWRQASVQGATESEVRDGVLRSMRTDVTPGPSEGAIIVASPERKVVAIDAFEAALLTLPTYIHTDPPLPLVPLPTASGDGNKVVQANGRTYTVSFDPKHSGRVSKVEFRFEKHRFESSVTKWQTINGTEIPAEVAQQGWYADEKTSAWRITLSDVQFGASAPAPPALPQPTRGALVMDEKRQVIYRVDENWKRISEEQKVGNGNIGGGLPLDSN
jgi:RNA polymerase sigma factor (sigma-70 family)